MRAKKYAILILLLIIPVVFNGCYYLKQGIYLLRYNSSGRSVERLLKDPQTEQKVRSFLQLVQEIKAYAIDTIGLKNNKNYTQLVPVNRDYIAVFVSAAEKLSFTLHKWCFPILGCIPYKGYFDLDDAKKEAEKLSRAGLDVNISEVSAFSTLGFLSDPLYSYMADYRVFNLASLIIHEQTHATIYLKNQAQFNEELATFVGNTGALEFLKAKYGENSSEYLTAIASMDDREVYLTLMKSLVAELDSVYKSNLTNEEKAGRKSDIIDSFRIKIRENYDQFFKTSQYKFMEKMPINNASLAVWMTYSYDLSVFKKLYEVKKNNLRSTFEYVKTLKRIKDDPKEHIIKMLSSS